MVEKVIGFWQGFPRFINNPILQREFFVRLRRKNSFLLLLVILVFCLLVSIFVWKWMINPPLGIDTNLFSRMVFMNFIAAAKFIFTILVLFITSTSLNQEINENTWDLIRTSPIRLSGILVGKLLAPLGFIVLILISFLPFYWVVMIRSGVSPSELFWVIAAMFETLLAVGIVGLYTSSRTKQPVRSITLAFLICFFVYYLMPAIFINLYMRFFLMSNSTSSLGYFLRLFGFISPGAIIQYMFGGMVPLPADFEKVIPIVFHLIVNVLISGSLLLLTVRNIRRKADQGGGSHPRRWKKYIFWGDTGENLANSKPLSFPDWCNPVWIKERCELVGRNTYKPYFGLIGLVILGTGMTFISLGLFGLKFDLNNLTKLVWMPVFVAPFLILPYAAGAFRAEMDRNTWEILISSPLSPQTILSGKMLAGCYLFLRRFWAFFGFWVVLGAILGHQMIVNDDHIKVMIYSVMISHAFGFFSLSLCLFYSLLSRKILAAYVWSFLSILILLLGPSFIDLIWPSDFLRSIYNVLCPAMIVNASMGNTIDIAKIETAIPWQIGWMLAGSCGLFIFIKNRIPKQIQDGNCVV